MAGEGRAETTSAPAAVGVSTPNTEAGPASLGAVDTSANLELTDEDFRQDGTLRVATQREIAEAVPGKGTSRSYNSVTGKTVVTSSVGGRTVTFEEDGDTRGSTERKG